MSTTSSPILSDSPDWELDPKFAHPRAQELFAEEFYGMELMIMPLGEATKVPMLWSFSRKLTATMGFRLTH